MTNSKVLDVLSRFYTKHEEPGIDTCPIQLISAGPEKLLLATVLRILLNEHSQDEYPTELCDAIVEFVNDRPGTLCKIVKEVVDYCLKTENKETLLRDDNIVTALFKSILHFYALPLVAVPIKALISEMKKTEWSLFKETVAKTDVDTIVKLVSKIAKLTTNFLDAIDHIQWPREVITTLSVLFQLVEVKFVGMGLKIVSSLLYLRFISAIIVNPAQNTVPISPKTLEHVSYGLHLFSKIIYLIHNDGEFTDSDKCTWYLNVVVKKHSSTSKYKLLEKIKVLSSNACVDITSPRTQANTKSRKNASKLLLQYYLKYEIPIWQQLIKEEKTEIAQELENYLTPKSREMIETLKSEKITLSFSRKNIELLKTIFDFFNGPLENSQQLAIVIKEIAINNNLFDSIGIIANLHNKTINNEENSQQLIKLESIQHGIILFPNYAEKINLLIEGLKSSYRGNTGHTHPQMKGNLLNLIHYLENLYFAVVPSDQTLLPPSREEFESNLSNEASSADDVDVKFPFNPPSADSLYTTECKIKLKLFCWGIPEFTINQLVPDYFHDDISFVYSDTDKTKLVTTLHVRKLLKRKIMDLRHSPQRVVLASDVVVPFHLSTLNNAQLCYWFKLIGFSVYVPLIEQHKLTGASFMFYDSKALKHIGIAVHEHRKAIIIARNHDQHYFSLGGYQEDWRHNSV